MSELQKFLLLVFVVLATAVLGRFAWALILPLVIGMMAAVPPLLGAIPGWLWWVVFGVTMSMICPLKSAFFGGRCRTSSRCGRSRSFGSA
jgi:hypothetical protein